MHKLVNSTTWLSWLALLIIFPQLEWYSSLKEPLKAPVFDNYCCFCQSYKVMNCSCLFVQLWVESQQATTPTFIKQQKNDSLFHTHDLQCVVKNKIKNPNNKWNLNSTYRPYSQDGSWSLENSRQLLPENQCCCCHRRCVDIWVSSDNFNHSKKRSKSHNNNISSFEIQRQPKSMKP